MTIGLIDPSCEWPSCDERGNASCVWLPERIARTSELTTILFLAHARNIKRECLTSERTNRNSEITADTAFQPNSLPTFAHIASLQKEEREQRTSVISYRSYPTRQHSLYISTDKRNIVYSFINMVPHSNPCVLCSRDKGRMHSQFSNFFKLMQETLKNKILYSYQIKSSIH